MSSTNISRRFSASGLGCGMGSLLVVRRPSAIALLSRLDPLGFETPLVSAAGRFRRPALDWLARHRQQHFPQPCEAVLAVAVLIARALAGKNQLPFIREARRIARQKSRPHVFGEAGAGGRRPAHHSLAVHLVDILAPRPRAAREGELEFAVGDLNASRDDENGARGSERQKMSVIQL